MTKGLRGPRPAMGREPGPRSDWRRAVSVTVKGNRCCECGRPLEHPVRCSRCGRPVCYTCAETVRPVLGPSVLWRRSPVGVVRKVCPRCAEKSFFERVNSIQWDGAANA